MSMMNQTTLAAPAHCELRKRSGPKLTSPLFRGKLPRLLAPTVGSGKSYMLTYTSSVMQSSLGKGGRVNSATANPFTRVPEHRSLP